MITVTEKAQTKIKENLNKRGKGVGIHVGVKTTGCSGLAYTLEYIDENNKISGMIDDVWQDFIVRIDLKNEPYLKGMTIDYIKNGLNEGFEFKNPNERDKCGCGKSFRV